MALEEGMDNCLMPSPNSTGNGINGEQLGSIDYFITQLVSRRTLIPVEQSGLHMLVSRALQQPELMTALQASSAAHQLQSFPEATTNEYFQRKAQYEYSEALSSFSRYLRNGQVDFERAATCAILLTFTDVVQGGTEEWYHHLQGAIAIINGARGIVDPRNITYHRFMTRFLIYHDVLAAVATASPTALDPSFYEEEEQQVVSENLHSVAGANSLLLASIARICRLNAAYGGSEPGDFGLLYSEADIIEQKLLSVQYSSACSLLLHVLHEAYRASGLLLLYQTLEFVESSASLIQILNAKSKSCYNDLMNYLLRIPVDTLISPALLFPLFIAGISSTSKTDQALIHEQLSALYSKLRFGNIKSALSILRDIWDCGTPNATLMWQSFIYRRKWRLALA